MKYFHILFIASITLLACHKEKIAPGPVDPTNPTPGNTDIPIYQPGDTSMGAAYAKKLTADWTARVVCSIHYAFDSNYIAISFLTYDQGALKETFNMLYIPRSGEGKTFALKKMPGNMLVPGFVSPGYNTWTFGGDVPEDNYYLDTDATDNFVKIEKIDLVNMRIEGTFTATFKTDYPQANKQNPLSVKFSAGKFWAVIQQ